ncbi:hypothetical protein [Ereboglobus luteus]|uniref:hypothetical protein n=1 Tax=Ereboglobus luteus TaxID=1796921 RepID=UPI0012600C5C|nr:hypothetical protein [Ereboglobus luteus]
MSHIFEIFPVLGSILKEVCAPLAFGFATADEGYDSGNLIAVTRMASRTFFAVVYRGGGVNLRDVGTRGAQGFQDNKRARSI